MVPVGVSSTQLDIGALLQSVKDTVPDTDKIYKKASSEGITLSKDQRIAYTAMSNMKPGNMLFLTGKAGTGKSTLIDRYCAENVGVIKLAPTGIAAQNIDGRTIHAFLGLNPTVGILPDPSVFKTRIAGYSTIIVDEISMVGDKLFGMLLRRFEQFSPIQFKFIFVGDFEQLEPVNDKFCFYNKRWEAVKKLELTSIHRQNDLALIEALNDIRECKMDTKRVRSLYKDRACEEFPDDATVISSKRATTEEHNNSMLAQLGADIKVSEAQVLNGTFKDNKIPHTLKYAIGARVLMLTNNYDDEFTGVTWVNGSTGVIRDVKSDGEIIIAIDGKHKLAHVYRETHQILNGAGTATCEFKQYPFQLGYAITIHKCQGMSMDKVVVDMQDHFGGYRMTYVALSRCRTKRGLYLIF